MIALFDTSVLIASIVKEHPDHSISFQAIQKVQKKEIKGIVSSHTLLECYAVLTGLQKLPIVSPPEARKVIQEIVIDLFDVVPSTIDDSIAILDRVSQKHLRSGIVYDALILQAGLQKKASHLVTWNQQHFARLIKDEIILVTPNNL